MACIKKIFCILCIILSFTNASFAVTKHTKSVIFLVHNFQFGGKGVYDTYLEMKKRNIDVKIAVIPYFIDGKFQNDIDLNYIKKFDQKDLIFPCGKQAPYIEKCKPLNSFSNKIDYLFISNPYNEYSQSVLYPALSHPFLLLASHKIMYILYGPHIFSQKYIFDKNLPKFVDTIFVDTHPSKKLYEKEWGFAPDKTVIAGYQTYKNIRDTLKITQAPRDKETILWMPRWRLDFKYRDQFEGGSTFLNYHYFFYNYAKEHPDKQLVIRPHTHLFTHTIRDGWMTQEDFDAIWERFESLPNVRISRHKDNELVNDILESDIIIAGGTSALGEAMVAGKPVIYLSNGLNQEFEANILSKTLKKNVYLAYDPKEIKDYIQIIGERDYKAYGEESSKEKRKAFLEILDPIENPAALIADYILHDNPLVK